MSSKAFANVSVPSVVIPLVGCVVLAVSTVSSPGWLPLLCAAAALLASVAAAVQHAEVIAHRVGEPFGTLVLALAVTVSMMRSVGAEASTLARDTVFATVMIICNGVVGLCLLAGSVRHNVIAFRVEGTTPVLAVLTTLTTLTLVLPALTTSTTGPTFTSAQLVFAGVVSLVLYAVFIFVQTARHREFFLPDDADFAAAHATRSPAIVAWVSLALLVISLVAVVGLAKVLAPSIESMVAEAGMPQSVVGIIIALIVLLPETWAAVRAALRNQMQ